MENLFASNLFTRRQNDLMKLSIAAFAGIIFGFLVAQNFETPRIVVVNNVSRVEEKPNKTTKIWDPPIKKGTENLPPGIISSESDFYPRRLWGNPNEDLTTKPKYLIAFTVGYAMRNNIHLAVKKFLDNFTIMLFHYDGRVTEWNEFNWSKNAIHISVERQTKWWYAKRFLHPDIVAPYEYVFLWDEDLGVKHFDPEGYIRLVKKHGLEISQPAVESDWGHVWNITKRLTGQEIHREMDQEEKPWWCKEYKPPCAGFVEIMAPVFSRNAWKCVWHMIQNDLVHGWGLDKAFGKCVEPAHMKMGIVDAQWIVHQHIITLGNQGEGNDGKTRRERVNERCHLEEKMFEQRLQKTDAT